MRMVAIRSILPILVMLLLFGPVWSAPPDNHLSMPKISNISPTSFQVDWVAYEDFDGSTHYQVRVDQALFWVSGYLTTRLVQAMVPAGAEPLLNRNGTAPGLWCHAPGGKIVVMLPGPPRELQPMFQHDVLPRIRALAPPTVARLSLTVCGIPESAAADRVEALLRDSFPGLEPAYCARPHQVDIRLSAGAADQPRLEEAMRRLALRQQIVPRRYARGARAALRMLEETEGGSPEALLDSVWAEANPAEAEKREIRELILENSPGI